MASPFDVRPEVFIPALAEELAKNEALKAPLWASFVKTGVGKSRPPLQRNWWHLRMASILLSIYKEPTGVSTLRTKYGTKNNNRATKPGIFSKGSGKVIRYSLQLLEKAGLLKKTPKSGREITSAGRSLVDKLAKRLKGAQAQAAQSVASAAQ